MSDPTAASVAAWMAEEIETKGYLAQEDAVDTIAGRFGEQFTYLNDSGNPAIHRAVLRKFRKITETTAVWERGERAWRKRSRGDSPGRQQWG